MPAASGKSNWKDAPAMGNAILAATSTTKPSGFNASYLILILIVVLGFYMLMIRPQQRRRQQVMQQQNSVQPGARVRTTAGMYATVVDVDGDDVVLEVAPGIEVRYMKRAIMDVVSAGAPPEDTYDADAEQPVEDPDGDAEAEHTPDGEVADDTADTAYEKATGTKKD